MREHHEWRAVLIFRENGWCRRPMLFYLGSDWYGVTWGSTENLIKGNDDQLD